MNSIFNVSDKTILIVGASSGIGTHFAKTLAKQGATLLIAARRLEKLKALESELLTLGAKAAQSYSVDVTDYDAIQEVIATIESQGHRIEVLILTAGINVRTNFLGTTQQDWQAVRAINLDGNWWVSQAVGKHMIRHKIQGSIVHLTSAVDNRVSVMSSHAYQATKAAMRQLTKSMANELAPHHIRVNAIAPGYFETDLNRSLLRSEAGQKISKATPLGRTGDLSELEGPLLLLCSKASSYMTGSVVRVDGGYASGHIALG